MCLATRPSTLSCTLRPSGSRWNMPAFAWRRRPARISFEWASSTPETAMPPLGNHTLERRATAGGAIMLVSVDDTRLKPSTGFFLFLFFFFFF